MKQDKKNYEWNMSDAVAVVLLSILLLCLYGFIEMIDRVFIIIP